MTKTDYTAATALIVSEAIDKLITHGLLPPESKEPLKDELLTAIDWHCAPRL